MAQYFQNEEERELTYGINLEWRAAIALDLIRAWGTVAAKRGEVDDQTGRATTELQTPSELVERCFNIADYFVEWCEKRGDLKPATVSTRERMMRRAEWEHEALSMRYRGDKNM